MKTLIILIIFMLMQSRSSSAQATFYAAKAEIEAMLAGNAPLSYERAVFLTENAYWNNELDEKEFSNFISIHTENIKMLVSNNKTKTIADFKSTIYKSAQQQYAMYEKNLINWAIFTYITDTTYYTINNQAYYHLPYTYNHNDPLGTTDWRNTQVNKLLYADERNGNCYALSSLYKIFADRLQSGANIATAPGHIYIRHADDKGIQYNVELATRAFPGTGSLSTLTYTTDEAIQSGISMRTLNTKEAVALTLVYLAKGYQYKHHKTDTFLISCATTALQYDSLNLNALLLKAEVLENELLAQNKAIAQLKNNKIFNDYEQLIIKLYNLGYREMPVAMKQLVLNALKQDGKPIITKNHAPKPFKDIDDKIQYATLSHGLFEEIHIDKPYEQYSSTLFNTKTKIIIKFIHKDTLIDNYNFDPVVFALSIDPLAAKYPSMSPYAAFANNPIRYVDNDGREPIDPRTGKPIPKLDLYRAAVYELHYMEKAKLKPMKDYDLYANANPIIKRGYDAPDGAWDGAAYNRHETVWEHTSLYAINALNSLTGVSGGDYGGPNDDAWRTAAEMGSYIFVDDKYSESQWLHINLLEYNIIAVKENYLSKIINLSRPNDESKYNINSVTTFDVQKGEIKTREVNTWWGGKKTEKFRTLTVTEKTTIYENNQASDKTTSKKYTSEEIVN